MTQSRALPILLVLLVTPLLADADERPAVSFFLTSEGPGNGGALHEDRNDVREYTTLKERGEEVNGRVDAPNRHDILTGSDSMGRLHDPDPAVSTFDNWTSSSDAHSARIGHHDRLGGANASWNSVHDARGCSQPSLVATGGDGLLYCFAAD